MGGRGSRGEGQGAQAVAEEKSQRGVHGGDIQSVDGEVEQEIVDTRTPPGATRLRAGSYKKSFR